MPLSTDTICSFGWRSKMPAKMLLITTRALFRKSMVPPTAGLMFWCCDAQKYLP